MAQPAFYRVHENDVDIQAYQLQKLNQLLVFAVHCNEFYKEKLKDITLPIRSLEELNKLPLTLKKELAEDQIRYAPFGRNHSYPETSYIRYHQTSGTSGRPLKVLDTKESWDWWQDCWLEVLKSAGVTSKDRLFLAFGFGPFIGFWAAYEAAKKAGTLVIPGGAQSSSERLYSILENKANVLLCTPSYALHLAEIAEQNGFDIKNSHVHTMITAGEPGGSIASVREQIESHWNAKLYDHVGMTEIGAYGFSCSQQKGIHVNESQFLAEVINPETIEPVTEGERGELVLTNLGRYGFPLIRYRTGDMVRKNNQSCSCGNPYRFFEDGILGRADDMVIVRGVNIYPQSIEAIVREFREINEFRIVYYTVDEMNQVKVQIEASMDVTDELKVRLRERIGLRIEVERLENGELPRFELKARRVLDQRDSKVKKTP
ncbi:AMP-binding protein [Brevibacillus choshinensis]|uniref:phenylacetate--CoA ligase family protein n=1 Tax=Brevibacillus choshinensis TaxID=54911 RepID=UPI002E200C82|nr:AMP-binding protein [Brevibacillus choshinensis]MED4779944.1 AMP-binding protein [Brevibacillus choshinensis]